MKINKTQYQSIVKENAGKSNLPKNMFFAFIIGGGICALGQVLTNVYEMFVISSVTASTLTTITLIFLSVTLTSLNIYDDIANFAGAGTLVPITGFANAMASSALEYKKEGLILGVGTMMFSIAGPVIVFGTSASVVLGAVIVLFDI